MNGIGMYRVYGHGKSSKTSQKATGFTPAGKIIALIVIAGAAFGLFKVFSGGNLLGFLAPGTKHEGIDRDQNAK